MLVDPHRTFESLLVSSVNRPALRAVRRTIGDGATRPNPLLIVGPPGSGKTHVLHAVANTLLATRRHHTFRMLTAEMFTESFRWHIREGFMPSFRAQMRGVSTLCIDNMEDTEGRSSTMDELDGTLRFVVDHGGSAILTAGDCTPGHMAELARFVESYERGLVVRWYAPPIAVRVAAMRRVLRTRRVRMPVSRLVELARRAATVPEATALVQRELLTA